MKGPVKTKRSSAVVVHVAIDKHRRRNPVCKRQEPVGVRNGSLFVFVELHLHGPRNKIDGIVCHSYSLSLEKRHHVVSNPSLEHVVNVDLSH